MMAKEPAATGQSGAEDLSEQTSGDGDFRELRGDIGPCRTTFAPILISSVRRVVRDQCSTASGKASVRRKLARL